MMGWIYDMTKYPCLSHLLVILRPEIEVWDGMLFLVCLIICPLISLSATFTLVTTFELNKIETLYLVTWKVKVKDRTGKGHSSMSKFEGSHSHLSFFTKSWDWILKHYFLYESSLTYYVWAKQMYTCVCS